MRDKGRKSRVPRFTLRQFMDHLGCETLDLARTLQEVSAWADLPEDLAGDEAMDRWAVAVETLDDLLWRHGLTAGVIVDGAYWEWMTPANASLGWTLERAWYQAMRADVRK